MFRSSTILRELVEKDYLVHVAACRKFGSILYLACPRSVPRAFGFRKSEGIFSTTILISSSGKTLVTCLVNTVCPGKTKTFGIDASLSFYREAYGSWRSQYLSSSRYLTNPLFSWFTTTQWQGSISYQEHFYANSRAAPFWEVFLSLPATTHPFSSRAPDD